MKIFLIGNPRKEGVFFKNFEILNKYIKDADCTAINNDLTDKQYADFEKKMKKDVNLQKIFYKDIMRAIDKSDICIFEASDPSLAIGHLIEKSLSLLKPTIVLFYKEVKSYIVPHINNEKLITRTYTEKTLKRVLKQTLNLAKQRRDKRFNFYLSTKLLEYIETLGREEGSTKSKVMRDIILRDMRNRGELTGLLSTL